MTEEIRLDDLGTGWVPAADIVLGLVGPATTPRVLARDAAGWLELPINGAGHPLGLSGDGRRLLVSPLGGRRSGVGVLTLGTGDLTWHEGDEDRAAAFSPGGDLVATVTTADDPDDRDASIAAIEVLGGSARSRLWSAPGSWSAETTVSWAPDGTAVAATYLTAEDDFATVIVDLDGTVRADLPGFMALRSTNATWLNERELLAVDGDFQLCTVDRDSGDPTVLRAVRRVPWAYRSGELIQDLELGPGEDTRLVTGDLDGGEPRPFLSVHPAHLVSCVEVARPSS